MKIQLKLVTLLTTTILAQLNAADFSELKDKTLVAHESLTTYGDKSAEESPITIDQLTLAAENGDAGAQYELAQAYENGDGVDKNLTEAVRLYKLASSHPKAQKRLAEIRGES